MQGPTLSRELCLFFILLWRKKGWDREQEDEGVWLPSAEKGLSPTVISFLWVKEWLFPLHTHTAQKACPALPRAWPSLTPAIPPHTIHNHMGSPLLTWALYLNPIPEVCSLLPPRSTRSAVPGPSGHSPWHSFGFFLSI